MAAGGFAVQLVANGTSGFVVAAAFFEVLEGGAFDVAEVVDEGAVFFEEAGVGHLVGGIGEYAVEAAKAVAAGGALAVVQAAPTIGFGFLDNAGSDGIELDVGATALYDFLVAQVQTLETTAPQIAGAVAGFVVPIGKRLLEGFAKLRYIFQFFPGFADV